MNEAETGDKHNHPGLKATGWGVVAGSRVRLGHELAVAWLKVLQ
jgi:hypothetical protein